MRKTVFILIALLVFSAMLCSCKSKEQGKGADNKDISSVSSSEDASNSQSNSSESDKSGSSSSVQGASSVYIPDIGNITVTGSNSQASKDESSSGNSSKQEGSSSGSSSKDETSSKEPDEDDKYISGYY